ncbi:MAG TPA: 4'-phosphopantetheinyl transferase superfamily protein [Pyrinomonadaceae bacterium]
MGETHVWRASLNLDAAASRACSELLSTDERQRAARYHFRKDREHFCAARGALRSILAAYLDVPPARLVFSYGRYGKPALDGAARGARLRFNAAHSHGIALYAVTLDREVGVDVELVRDDFAGLDIAERFFSRAEVDALRALPPQERATAFFDCWTRKEAYIKARGEGLSLPLHRFTVSLARGEPPRLVSADDDPREASRWSLVELHPGPGYRAALAVEGRAPAVRCWRWPAARGPT